MFEFDVEFFFFLNEFFFFSDFLGFGVESSLEGVDLLDELELFRVGVLEFGPAVDVEFLFGFVFQGADFVFGDEDFLFEFDFDDFEVEDVFDDVFGFFVFFD